MIFYKTFILGNFSDRRYWLDYKYICYKKIIYEFKIIGNRPGGLYRAGGGGWSCPQAPVYVHCIPLYHFDCTIMKFFEHYSHIFQEMVF